MELSDLGAHSAMLGYGEQENLAARLLFGEFNTTDYTSGNCHETSAYVGFLLGRNISPFQLTNTLANDWIEVFNFPERGTIWDGKSGFDYGDIIGFQAPHAAHPSGITHSATATGMGCRIRGVNSFLFNPGGWTADKDLREACNIKNEDGTFKVDGANYTIYVLPLYH